MRLIDADILKEDIITKTFGARVCDIDNQPTVQAVPIDKIKEFVEYIQSIKDEHNDKGSPINYGTICDLVIRGWKLVERKDECEVTKSQEPKIGYWRPIYQGDEIINYRCSECEFGNTFGKSTYGMNYCPNCGARMVETQKRSE